MDGFFISNINIGQLKYVYIYRHENGFIGMLDCLEDSFLSVSFHTLCRTLEVDHGFNLQGVMANESATKGTKNYKLKIVRDSGSLYIL